MLLALGQQRGPQIRVQGGGFVSFLPAAGAPPPGPAFLQLSMTYLLSLYRSMAQGSLSWRSASSRAVISMRLLVVLASPPESSFSYTFCAVRNRRIAPQPPGPGLPLQAPSVINFNMLHALYSVFWSIILLL